MNEKTSTELTNLFKSWQSQEPSMENELQHLTKDLNDLSNTPRPSVYTLNQSKISDLEKFLIDNKSNTSLPDLEKEILDLANKLPSDESELISHELQILSGTKKQFQFNELIIHFGKQDVTFLERHNNSLTSEDIQLLQEKIGNYLLLATHEQQRIRCLNIVKQIKNCPNGSLEEKELIQKLGESFNAERCYDPIVNPNYLVFEYYLDIKIREGQKNKFANLEPNTVVQMLMGEGKTTVLFQLLGELHADGNNLSLLVLPEPLFNTVGLYTQKVHSEAFGKKLRTLYFDRNSTFTKHSLEAVLDNLKNAIEERECLIMTSKSISCLILKCLEQSFLEDPEKESSIELKQMLEIISLLRKSGYPLIDEIDTILRVQHEVSFSTGDLVPITEVEYTTISELYDILYNDAEIKKLTHIDSNPESSKSAPALTQDFYHKNIKEILANRFVDRFSSMKFESKELQHKVNHFASSLNQKNKHLLVSYLIQNEKFKNDTEIYYNSLDPDIQDIIALASEEITRFLPHTLVMNCDEHYGNGGDLFPLPFEAADSPNYGSEFKNSHIMINATFQMYVKQGIPESAIIKVIEQLQQQALQEMQDDPTLDIINTNALKTFNKIKGDLDFPLLKYNQTQLNALTAIVNKDTFAKSRFVINAFLPHLKRYSGSISLNPQNFISFFDQSAGFSGTLANALTMHHKLRIQPEAGTDAKTLKALFEKARNEVTIVDDSSIATLFKNSGTNFDTLIDIGGYCKGKELSPSRVADFLAKESGEKVVFYSKDGSKQEISRQGTAPFDEKLSPGQKTIFDQSRSTGGDIKQKTTAVGVITIGKNITTRDLFQAARRMRELDKGQTVKFLINEEVASIIREICMKDKGATINFDDILYFAINNQSKRLSQEYFKAFKQQLWNIPQMMLLKTTQNQAISKEDRKAAQKLLKEAWISPINQPPRILYGMHAIEMDSSEAIQQEKKRNMDFIEKCFKLIPSLKQCGLDLNECSKETNLVVNRFAKLVPTKIRLKELDDNQTSETETETESEQHTEIENEVHNEKRRDTLNVQIIDQLVPILSLDDQPIAGNYMSVALFFNSKPELKKYASAFAGIHMTINVPQYSIKTPSINNLMFFGQNRTPLNHFAVQEDGSIILLCREDAEGDLSKAKLTLDNITLCNPSLYNFDQETINKITKDIVKIKFLNGEYNYNKEERYILKNWLLEEGVEKMRELYLKHVLTGHPYKKAAYNMKSNLKKLFKELSV